MAGQLPSSKLLYFGTDIEMQLGDRIRITRFLRRPIGALICYIPGISLKNPSMEFEDVQLWAYRTDDGIVYVTGYDPIRGQPSKRIQFIERTDAPGLSPDEEFD